MTSMELQARKMGIIEELLQLNTMEALDKVAQVVRTMRREEKVKSPCMYTTEEVSCLLDQIVFSLSRSLSSRRGEGAVHILI